MGWKYRRSTKVSIGEVLLQPFQSFYHVFVGSQIVEMKQKLGCAIFLKELFQYS